MLALLFRRRALLSDPKRLGRWGQDKSERFLRRKGFRTLARNFYCKTGELDLVMADPADGVVVFVEVKTRSKEEYFAAEDSVTLEKRRRIVSAARYFLATNGIKERPSRFDVMAVVLPEKGKPVVRHFEHAFIP
jgi:putative endonuclease